jgi:hypothetical protein
MFIMRLTTLRKWLTIVCTSGVLLQAAPGGCPDTTQILGVASTSTQSFINGLIGLYVKAAVTDLFGL